MISDTKISSEVENRIFYIKFYFYPSSRKSPHRINKNFIPHVRRHINSYSFSPEPCYYMLFILNIYEDSFRNFMFSSTKWDFP